MDSGETKIRRASTSDAAAIADVMSKARDSALRYLPKLYTQDQIQCWIEKSVLANSEVWVAEADGGIVGFMSIAGEELDHLYVHPRYWSRGIGSCLLNIAKKQASKLRLYTFQKNERSRRFYEQHGFKLINLSDGANNEEREPDALYEWTLI